MTTLDTHLAQALMLTPPDAQDDDDETASSIHRLPREVLLLVLLHVRGSSDLIAFATTSKDMRALVSDDYLLTQWLFKHKKGRSEALSISAARMKREGVMLSLLKMGLSAIEPCGDYGHSPLELACRQNFHHVVKWLFAREDVRSTETQQITDAVDALFIAAEWGAAECLQIMLTPPSPLIERLNRRNLKDQCALEVAAHHSRSEQAVRTLLSAGASPTTHNGYGRYALHAACMKEGNDLIRAGIVRALLAAASDGQEVSMDSKDVRGNTPIMFAAQHGLLETCKVLISVGASVNVVNQFGFTPHRLAGREGHSRVQSLLQEHGAAVT